MTSPDPGIAAAVARGNPVCFLDVSVGSTPIGRIKLELFREIAPARWRTLDSWPAVNTAPSFSPWATKAPRSTAS